MARAVAPVVGVALLIVVTVVAAAAVGTTVLSAEPREQPQRATLAVTAEASTDRITVRHAGGDALDVHALSLSISVEGEDLAHQPPIPYFAAEGFVGAPTGPFNQDADPRWSAGESASLQIASTNEPTLSSGDRVTVVLATERTVLARVRTLAE